MPKILFILLLMNGCYTARSYLREAEASGGVKVQVGPYQARALWHPGQQGKPTILMLPGSGQQGPEEYVPATLSADGVGHPLFSQLAEPFVRAGFSVLQLGKPGVDYVSDGAVKLYDAKMVEKTTWNDLLKNAASGLDFLRQQSGAPPERIYILGHSEGTRVAVHIASEQKTKGLILLGFSGEDLLTTVHWQIFDRDIDALIKTDIDANHDGFITRAEAGTFPDFKWPWKDGQDRVSVDEVAAFSRQIPAKQQAYDQYKNSPYCSDGHCASGPIYSLTAGLEQDLYVFTGSLDLQTRPAESLKLQETCKQVMKKNCYVEILQGLQHGFNEPKAPRRHPLLDMAIGPVSPAFQARLTDLARILQ